MAPLPHPAATPPAAKQAATSAEEVRGDVHLLIQAQAWVNQLVGVDLLAETWPRRLPWYIVINFHKFSTVFLLLHLMRRFDNYSASACFYTAAHGSYGLVSILKHFLIPDAKWQTQTTIASQVASFVAVLAPYWFGSYLLISRMVPAPSNFRCCIAMMVYVVGLSLMLIADCYKFVALKYKKGTLVTDGPFALVRHPNYLGEMLVYGSFAAMVPHVTPWTVVGGVWFQLFLPNMKMKEVSMARYPEWPAYYARTGMLLPWPPALRIRLARWLAPANKEE